MKFIDPVDMYSNSQDYDRYLVFPYRTIIQPGAGNSSVVDWTNNNFQTVAWTNNSGDNVNWINSNE